MTNLASTLCATAPFNFVKSVGPGGVNGYFESSLALLTLYYYDNRFNIGNQNYYDQFFDATNCGAFCVTNAIKTNDLLYSFISLVQSEVYFHYQNSENICQGAGGICTFGNLTYNQWENGKIMLNSPSWMPLNDLTQFSYVQYFEGYTVNTVYVEPKYWGTMTNNQLPLEVTVQDVYQGWQVAGMFNPKFFADLLLNSFTNAPAWEQNFANSTGVPLYQKYVALNFGLGGLFKPLTPKMLIEGYTDSHAEYFMKKPVFMGGEPSIVANFGVDPPNRYSITNSTISMFTGVSDDDLVRQFSLWNNMPTMNIQKNIETGTRTNKTDFVNPWGSSVMVMGSDGAQFQGDLDEDEDGLMIFVNGLQRNFGLVGTGPVTNDAYDKLTIFNYILDTSYLQNTTANMQTYNTMIWGTSNMTTLAMTNSFASQGHWYGLSSNTDVQKSIPTVKNGTTGATITPNKNTDTTYFQIEQLSGITTTTQSTW